MKNQFQHKSKKKKFFFFVTAACKSTMGDHKEAVKDYDVAQYLTPNDTLTLIERGKVKALMEGHYFFFFFVEMKYDSFGE